MNRPANALIHEASPYLLQHAHNPVDWLPWGDAAFDRAQRDHKPVFLSIGYAACHWCHVMERESFEDEGVASLLNEHFVCVKVDREERPDVDHHFMSIVQALTGSGGWPLSVFLTPERRAFCGGTYWPPRAQYGRPGFRDVLLSIFAAWKERRADIESAVREIDEHFSSRTDGQTAASISANLADEAVRLAAARFDAVHGGFGGAPKFPNALKLSLLLLLGEKFPDAAGMALKTLRQMAYGGIHDQLGGGFHRYATDTAWRIPHFEKMLYDNALLIPAYCDAALLTQEELYRNCAQRCLEWAVREMELPEGGFAASLDADSEGKEGRYYVWSAAEIDRTIGSEHGANFRRVFHVTTEGNFEHDTSTLFTSEAAIAEIDAERLRTARAQLLQARNDRVRPARDDKVLTDWNGLMLSALVRGAAFFPEESYLLSAQRYAERVLKYFTEFGRLPHTFYGARTHTTQFLLDYATLANGLIDLFLADGEARWLRSAVQLVQRLDKLFAQEHDCYRMSDELVSGKAVVDSFDHTTPSGVSTACIAMLKLHALLGDAWYRERAQAQLIAIAPAMARAPVAYAQAIAAAHLLSSPPATVVLVGDAQRTLWSQVARNNPLKCLTLWRNPLEPSELLPEMETLLTGKTAMDGAPTAYVCRNFTCELPVHTAAEVATILKIYAHSRASQVM